MERRKRRSTSHEVGFILEFFERLWLIHEHRCVSIVLTSIVGGARV